MTRSEYLAQLPKSEREGLMYAKQLMGYVKKEKGRFARGDDATQYLILGNRRVALNFDPENEALARLVQTVCRVTTLTPGARAAIQRIKVEAGEQGQILKYKRFAAMSGDGSRIYVPLANSRLLRVTAGEIKAAPNGENEDSFWVEHPSGEALNYNENIDAQAALSDFERLLVETQACRVPEMRWLVAMHEGLFPFVRESCPARMILVHLGPTQSGKTSGAQRFTMLHGLGEVKGDYSVAALGNSGDIGLLVLDNREQANFSPELVDFCLFLATGAERARSLTDGTLRVNSARPVGVITSIEGVVRAELRKRCLAVEYRRPPGDLLRRGPIEREILQRRHKMGSALMVVLRRYLQIRDERHPPPNPIPEFEEHFTALCDLLRAFGDIAGKPKGWGKAIIDTWDRMLVNRDQEEDELEHLVVRVLKEPEFCNLAKSEAVRYRGQDGILFVTEASQLLSGLQKVTPREAGLPRNAAGLSRRLKGTQFRSFLVLDEELAPEFPALQRTKSSRPLGLFQAGDEMTQSPHATEEIVTQQTLTIQ